MPAYYFACRSSLILICIPWYLIWRTFIAVFLLHSLLPIRQFIFLLYFYSSILSVRHSLDATVYKWTGHKFTALLTSFCRHLYYFYRMSLCWGEGGGWVGSWTVFQAIGTQLTSSGTNFQPPGQSVFVNQWIGMCVHC
jgi:hypothetical protein